MERPITVSSKGKLQKFHIHFIHRLVEKARQQIMEQEDAEIFKVLDSIAKEE